MKRLYLKSAAMKRAGSRQWVLKPQDLAVALKLVSMKDRWLPYAELGEAMHLSRFEAHAAVQRLIAARLFYQSEDDNPRPVMQSLRQFVMFGAPFAYPAVMGEMTIGLPTAHGAPLVADILRSSAEPVPVWPYPKGRTRGMALLPLYQKLPMAAEVDGKLYELLALFDALRSGQARERGLAKKYLEERLQ